jgi:hypothetical protein
LWYRRLDPGILPSLTALEAGYREYEELNPYATLLPDGNLIGLLAPQGFMVPSYDGAEQPGSWKPLDPPTEEGYVIFPFNSLNMMTDDAYLEIKIVAVPEPLGTAIVGVMSLWALARRRKA